MGSVEARGRFEPNRDLGLFARRGSCAHSRSERRSRGCGRRGRAAYPGYRAIEPQNFNYQTAARIALLFWTYLPGLRLRRFSRAILILPCRHDQINPSGKTIRRARECPSATLVEIDCEHMEVALEPHRSRIIRLTLDFLSQHVPSRKIQ